MKDFAKNNAYIKKNDEFDIEIIDYGSDGEGIAKKDGFAIFVKGALKGEICKIHIVKVLKNYAYATIKEIIKASPWRIESDCKTYPKCGGCALRHIKYEETLKIKQEKVQNLINKVGLNENNTSTEKNIRQNDKKVEQKNNNEDDEPQNEYKNNSNLITNTNYLKAQNTIGMETPYFYRNKAIYPINQEKQVGIYAARSHNIIPIEECKIQTLESQEIAKYIVENWNDTIYDEKTGKGILRNIMIREGFSTGEIMCVLVQNGTSNLKSKNTNNTITTNNKNNTNNKKNNNNDSINKINNCNYSEEKQIKKVSKINVDNSEHFSKLENKEESYLEKYEITSIDINKLIKKFPKIKTIVINVNEKNTNVVLSKKNIVIYGNGYITDILGEYKFRISPNSFYQVNPVQTEKIYNTAIERANLNKKDILCDLYCGIGTIGIFASKYVKKVYGIEIVPEAIKDAKENAKINHIENIEFIEGDVENAFEKLINKTQKDSNQNLIQCKEELKNCNNEKDNSNKNNFSFCKDEINKNSNLEKCEINKNNNLEKCKINKNSDLEKCEINKKNNLEKCEINKYKIEIKNNSKQQSETKTKTKSKQIKTKNNKNEIEMENSNSTTKTKFEMPNAVIVDPPRKGLDNNTINNLKKLKLQKLVYISCNPATLARDLKNLSEVYKINEIIPIDNFCYSSGVETIATLTCYNK